jgi:hypothetical protein
MLIIRWILNNTGRINSMCEFHNSVCEYDKCGRFFPSKYRNGRNWWLCSVGIIFYCTLSASIWWCETKGDCRMMQLVGCTIVALYYVRHLTRVANSLTHACDTWPHVRRTSRRFSNCGHLHLLLHYFLCPNINLYLEQGSVGDENE